MSTKYAYAPYGYHKLGQVNLGFTGELVERETGHYLLGNGYRAFNPILMNFNSPDSLSPFAGGGMNAYGYCQGDPVNFRDPSGHYLLAAVRNIAKRFSSNLPKQAASVPISRTPGVNSKPVPDGARLFAIHTSELNNTNSLEAGISPHFSVADGSVHSKAQGPGLYFTLTQEQSNFYLKRGGGKNHNFGLYLMPGKTLVEGQDYKLDINRTGVLLAGAFHKAVVRKIFEGPMVPINKLAALRTEE